MKIGDLFRRHKALWAILAVSLAVRIALVLRGGQFYYADEGRYLRCFYFLRHLADRDPRAAIDQILGTSEHVGFVIAGLPAAIVHIVYLGIHRLPETVPNVVGTAWVSGLCFTVPSVILIALVYAISRKAGATSAEAILAAFLFACSNAMFYFCRHFLSYDIAMALALFALWLDMAEKTSIWRSLRCGFLVGIALMTYNGYWIFCAIVLAMHVLYRVPNVAAAVKRAVPAALGAICLPVFLEAVSILLGKFPYLKEMASFSGTETQGDFREGAVFPFVYLWYTEHALAIVWGVATLLALYFYFKTEKSQRSPFILLCLAAVVATYLLLALPSVALEKITVTGRAVRQMIPWLSISSAYGISRAFQPGSRYRVALAAVCAALAVQAGFNMSHPFQMHFPSEIQQIVHSRYGEVNYYVTFNGPDDLNAGRPPASSPYVLVNAEFLQPLLSLKAPISGDVVISMPHPYFYTPYQYEGLSPRERDLLLQGDYSMRLIRLPTPLGNSQQSANRP